MPPGTYPENPRHVATNEIPDSYTDVVTLTEDAANGANTHESATGLKQNTGAVIDAALAAITLD